MYLRKRKVAHSFIDLDALAETFPRPKDDPYGSRLALRNLRDVWANCTAAGSRNLVVARVVETDSDLEGIRAAIPGSQATVCLLRATDDALLSRIRKREVGSGLAWHEQRTLELADSLEKCGPFDFVVDTDQRQPPDIAREIVDQVQWSV